MRTLSSGTSLPSGWTFRELREPFKDVRPRPEQYKISRWRSRVSHEELGVQNVEVAMSDSESEPAWPSWRDNVLTVPE